MVLGIGHDVHELNRGFALGHSHGSTVLMKLYHYECNDCGHDWYHSLVGSRCPAYECQSKNYTELPDGLGQDVTYNDFDDCFELEGEKTRQMIDKLGEPGRIAEAQYQKELKEDLNNAD